MRINCIGCGQRITLGVDSCPHCGINQLLGSDSNSEKARTIFKRIKNIFFWFLEIILIIVFAYMAVLVDTIALIQTISHPSIAGLLTVIIALLLTAIPGSLAFFLGRYLIKPSKKSQNQTMEVSTEKQIVNNIEPTVEEKKPNFMGRLNQWTNRICSRFPITVVIILLYMLVNGINEMIIQEAHRMYRDPSLNTTGSSAFAINMTYSVFFMFLLMTAHFILFVGGFIALMIDTILFNNRSYAG